MGWGGGALRWVIHQPWKARSVPCVRFAKKTPSAALCLPPRLISYQWDMQLFMGCLVLLGNCHETIKLL